MGLFGISGHTWGNIGKFALKAAPIVAAPFTGGASLLALGAGTGALSGALGGGGLKGALVGGALGGIPIPGIGGGVSGLAKGALKPTLAAGLKQAGGNVFKSYLGGNTGFGGTTGQPTWGDSTMNWGGGGAGTPGGGTADPSGGGTGGGGGLGNWGSILAQGAGVAAGALAGKWATKSAMKRSPEELAALRGQQGVADTAGQAGRETFYEGQKWLQQPANYYSTLLSGNRAAMQNAVGPATAQINENYRGANRTLEHSGLQGAQRNLAVADLNRQRVGQVAGLTAGVQGNAADKLGGLGTNMLGQSPGFLGQAGNIYGNLLNQGSANRVYGRGEGEKTAKAIGGLARDVGETVLKKKTAPKP